MSTKPLSKLKLTLVIASLFCCAQSYATEKKQMPWDFDSNIYREQLSESIQSGINNQDLINKDNQWYECATMAPTTFRMALGVKNNKEQPGFAREIILDLYPVDNDSFRDVINQKIMDLAFEMADLADGDKTSDESPVTQAAWDWCIDQDPKHFADF
ncbi:hypothetical protein [Shewanella sp. CAL98-MNA-CIBAN-0140]|uniref:hypothetical protein n=1 Tax=Shewanella sp. CAL98-MNA-CIBAN-0140 TaxID=3140462 RepID=UPI00331CEB54